MKLKFQGAKVSLICALAFHALRATAAEEKSRLGEPVLHIGCCDASAGVAVSSNLFIVANDEDNLLRVYRRDRSGAPVQSFQAGPFLQPMRPRTTCGSRQLLPILRSPPT